MKYDLTDDCHNWQDKRHEGCAQPAATLHKAHNVGACNAVAQTDKTKQLFCHLQIKICQTLGLSWQRLGYI